MPLYDYQCEQCQTVFEVRATILEKEVGLEPECPICHGKQARQIITAGLVLRGGGDSGVSVPGCSPNSRPGCCG